MKYICILFLFTPCFCSAQKTITLTPEYEQVMVDDVPKDKLPAGASELLFINSYSDTAEAFYLGYLVKDDQFKVLGKFTQDAEWFNGAKAASGYANDTIALWTQQPFRATQTEYFFLWKKNKVTFISSEMSDPSWDAIQMAEQALKEGKIQEAIDYYYQVQYPMAYMDENEVGFQILSKANELAMVSSKNKDYPKAVKYVETALGYYSLLSFTEPADEETLNEVFEDQYMTSYKDSFGLWMGNYGYFLYRADSLEKSIDINAKLNNTYPKLSGPYLQHADALYDLNKKSLAKQVYLRYMTLMKEKGKEKSVPERVHERVK